MDVKASFLVSATSVGTSHRYTCIHTLWLSKYASYMYTCTLYVWVRGVHACIMYICTCIYACTHACTCSLCTMYVHVFYIMHFRCSYTLSVCMYNVLIIHASCAHSCVYKPSPLSLVCLCVCVCVCVFVCVCSNCSDYDLCEKCERSSDLIHYPEHLFLKVTVPCLWLGRDPSGHMRPLLPYVAYSAQEMRYIYMCTCVYVYICVCVYMHVYVYIVHVYNVHGSPFIYTCTCTCTLYVNNKVQCTCACTCTTYTVYMCMLRK